MTQETTIARSLRLIFSSSIVLGLGAFSVAQAQTAAEAPMQRVEITGSSIKRAQAEGALPVQTVTRDEIRSNPAAHEAPRITPHHIALTPGSAARQEADRYAPSTGTPTGTEPLR